MKSISLSSRDLQYLKKYSFDSFECHSESIIYEMMLDKDYLLKISKDFISDGKELDIDKQMNIEFLNNLSFHNPSLTIPEYFVYVDNVLAGSATKKIDNARNLGTILNSRHTTLNTKLKYLKLVGSLLHEVQSKNLGFVFGDLHSYNFLVDDCDKLHVVDLDSIYRENNKPLKTLYFSNYKVLKNTSLFPYKYHVKNDMLYPNVNSDLLCYNYMLINTLALKNMHFLEISEFLQYISYLKDIGYGDDITNTFRMIYNSASNINPVLYFDSIKEDLEFQSMYSSFKKK